MAARLRFRLPPLKVTQWSSAGGKAVNRSVPRSFYSRQMVVEGDNDSSHDVAAQEEADPTVAEADFSETESITNHPGVTLYSIKEKSAALEWEALRPQLLKCVVGSDAMPDSQLCLLCADSPATMRCLKCGPKAYFCEECFTDLHFKINILHVGEFWEAKVRMLQTYMFIWWLCMYVYCRLLMIAGVIWH